MGAKGGVGGRGEGGGFRINGPLNTKASPADVSGRLSHDVDVIFKRFFLAGRHFKCAYHPGACKLQWALSYVNLFPLA
jgi:hypothetical protein